MNLLITGAWASGKDAITFLEQSGYHVQFLQQECDALPCPYEWVEAVVCNGLFLHHNIEKFQNLRLIQLTSAGFDRLPMEYVHSHNIEVFNARGVYSIPMAEFALCGVLQLYKQSLFFQRNQLSATWEKHRGLMELADKTVCIVGCGSVGTECAKRFRAFGCHVVGVDLYPTSNTMYDHISSLSALDNELSKADIVVLTLPLTNETQHLINADRIELMKQGSVLVNIARGAVVDSDALAAALRTKLLGAVLDVFEEEPLPPHSPLWSIEHILITPHNSFVSDGNTARLNQVIFSNLKVSKP